MLFFKAEGIVKSGIDNVENSRERSDNLIFLNLSDSFYCDNNEKIYIFISMLRRSKIVIGIITGEKCDIKYYLRDYLDRAGIKAELDINEITLGMFKITLYSAERMDFIPSAEYVASLLKINYIAERSRQFDEKIINLSSGKNEVYESAGKTLCEKSLSEELDRIYGGKIYSSFMGNPVHYIIRSDREDTCETVCKTLMQALYENNRIIPRRYSIIDVDLEKHRLNSEEIRNIYDVNANGAVYVNIQKEEIRRGLFVSSDTVEEIVRLCGIAKEFSKNVLTVFGINTNCKYAMKKIYECMENISFIEIDEQAVLADKAKAYLDHLAKKNEFAPDKKLHDYIKENVTYNAKELDEWFLEWSDKKMKTELFPQYAYAQRAAVKIKNEKVQGSAYEELQKMIGLKDVKEIIEKSLKYYKANKLFEARGLKTNHNAMHMVFTGNPGTAKTTVARLFAQIMKDNGILSVGNLVEVGRAELVGKYVGSTAPKVKEKFKEAQGSVLFIDEAYSLLDGEHNTFGIEAINTIVAEMENRRDDIIVIFAGYPKEMKEFLEKNPGMSSRIAFNVNFSDYSAEELYEITKLMASRQNMRFADGVKEKLISIYEDARENRTFGNGRYARNIYEKTLMNQGARIVSGDIDALSNADMQLITEDDIYVPEKTNKKKTVGFAV